MVSMKDDQLIVFHRFLAFQVCHEVFRNGPGHLPHLESIHYEHQSSVAGCVHFPRGEKLLKLHQICQRMSGIFFEAKNILLQFLDRAYEHMNNEN